MDDKKTISITIGEQTKSDAEAVLKKMGMNLTDSINIFLYQVILRKKFPFEIAAPADGIPKVEEGKRNFAYRADIRIKDQATEILSGLGISLSDAINIYLRQIILWKKIPFDISLPDNCNE